MQKLASETVVEQPQRQPQTKPDAEAANPASTAWDPYEVWRSRVLGRQTAAHKPARENS